MARAAGLPWDLAAAHQADLAAARNAGLAAAYIARSLEHGQGQPGACAAEAYWDLAAASITEIADRLQPGTARLPSAAA
jgi:2-haloacid dehalogenase